MFIGLHIDGRTPLVGRLVVQETEPIEFRGWLDLLRLLSELLEAADLRSARARLQDVIDQGGDVR